MLVYVYHPVKHEGKNIGELGEGLQLVRIDPAAVKGDLSRSAHK